MTQFYDVDEKITLVEEGFVKSLLNLAEQYTEGSTKLPVTLFTKEGNKPNYFVNSLKKVFAEFDIPVLTTEFNGFADEGTIINTINNTLGAYVYVRTNETRQQLNTLSTFAKPNGDIDCISYQALNNHALPSVVIATLKIIEHFNKDLLKLDGKTVLIVNRSAYVGQPLQYALMSNGATTIMCNSSTPVDVLTALIEQQHADIIIWATGDNKIGDKFTYTKNQLVIDLAQGDLAEPKGDAVFCKVPGRLTALSLVESYVNSLSLGEPLTQEQK